MKDKVVASNYIPKPLRDLVQIYFSGLFRNINYSLYMYWLATPYIIL